MHSKSLPASQILSRAVRTLTNSTSHKHISFQHRTMASGTPSETAQAQAAADAKAPSFSSLGIKHTDIKTASGVNLSDQQKVIVGSVLDVR